MEKIQLGGKEIEVSDITEMEEDFVPEEETEEISENQETEIVTIDDLDEDDPLQNASKLCFEACLATGQIPLSSTEMRLVLEIGYLEGKTNKKGEIKWEKKIDTEDLVTVQLQPSDRQTAIRGLASEWVGCMKQVLAFQRKYGASCNEQQASDGLRIQSEYEKSLSEFKGALKFLLTMNGEKSVRVNANTVGVEAVKFALGEIRKMKNPWAFDQFMLLPKPYIVYSMYTEGNEVTESKVSNSPVTETAEDDFAEN